jgi:hypothetical protein
MDKDLLHTLAEATATAAAREIGKELREELNRQFETAKDDLKKDLQAYFGEQKPSQHVIHHDRIERFLAWADRTAGTAFGRLVSTIAKYAVIALVAGWFLAHGLKIPFLQS